MNITTLKQEKDAPYHRRDRLTVKILYIKGEWKEYTNTKQERKKFKTYVVADQNDFCVMLNYEPKLENSLQVGTTVLVKSFAFRENELRLTSATSVYQIGNTLNIPESIVKAAEALQEPIKKLTIYDIRQSPVKSKVSVLGRIASDELPRQVRKRNNDTATVREIVLMDRTEKIGITLWNTATEVDVKVGDYIEIKEGTISFSQYYNDLYLVVNNRADIEQKEPPQDQEVISIEGFSHSNDNEIGIIGTNENGSDLELSIQKTLLLEFLKIKEMKEAVQKLPKQCKITYQGNQITEIKTVDQ